MKGRFTMSFRKYTTYNKNDTRLVIGKRIVVANDVEKRCNLILDLLRDSFYIEKKCSDIIRPNGYNIDYFSASKLSCIIDYMLEINDTYKRSDIMYAIRRLCDMGFIHQSKSMGVGWYSLSHNPDSISVQIKSAA